MEANELRIGNVVMDDDNNICTVSGLFQDFNDEPYNVEVKDSDGMFMEVQLEDLKPIPLTKEWLKKLGFKNDEEWVKLSFDTRICIRFFNGNSAECDIVQDDKFIAFKNSHLQYLHQLQNLYFTLSGKELEIKEAVKP